MTELYKKRKADDEIQILINDAKLPELIRYMASKIEDMEERLARFELKEELGEYYDYLEMMTFCAKICKSFNGWNYETKGDYVVAMFPCTDETCSCGHKKYMYHFNKNDRREIEALKREVEKATAKFVKN